MPTVIGLIKIMFRKDYGGREDIPKGRGVATQDKSDD